MDFGVVLPEGETPSYDPEHLSSCAGDISGDRPAAF